MKLEIKDLRFAYPSGEEAIKGINLTIEGTDPVAIIGQNGAGKTTLVKHFNGILRPTSGDILINGESISTRSTAKWSKEVGYVFQNPDDQLFLDTVQKELEFGPQKIGMAEAEIKERMKTVTVLCGLQDKLEMHPFDLTPTEKKFCTIASIIMMNPQVLIFDEPTCGQDVAGNQRLLHIIESLQEQGKLCITISHDMKFVVKSFQRVVLLCKGQILLEGSSREVFAQPDVLSQSFVTPPPVTRTAQQAGIQETIFSVDDLIKVMKNQKMKVTGNA